MDDRKRFAGKVLVITGGGGDIGRQTAQYMAGEGASIALVDIDAEKLAAAKAELASTAGGVSTYRCDVGSYSELQAAARSIENDLGGIDLLFNNAGYQGAFEPLHRYPADDFEAVIRVNVLGAFNVLKAVSARSEIPGTAAFLMSDAASCITGANIPISGGI